MSEGEPRGQSNELGGRFEGWLHRVAPSKLWTRRPEDAEPLPDRVTEDTLTHSDESFDELAKKFLPSEPSAQSREVRHAAAYLEAIRAESWEAFRTASVAENVDALRVVQDRVVDRTLNILLTADETQVEGLLGAFQLNADHLIEYQLLHLELQRQAGLKPDRAPGLPTPDQVLEIRLPMLQAVIEAAAQELLKDLPAVAKTALAGQLNDVAIELSYVFDRFQERVAEGLHGRFTDEFERSAWQEDYETVLNGINDYAIRLGELGVSDVKVAAIIRIMTAHPRVMPFTTADDLVIRPEPVTPVDEQEFNRHRRLKRSQLGPPIVLDRSFTPIDEINWALFWVFLKVRPAGEVVRDPENLPRRISQLRAKAAEWRETYDKLKKKYLGEEPRDQDLHNSLMQIQREIKQKALRAVHELAWHPEIEETLGSFDVAAHELAAWLHNELPTTFGRKIDSTQFEHYPDPDELLALRLGQVERVLGQLTLREHPQWIPEEARALAEECDRLYGYGVFGTLGDPWSNSAWGRHCQAVLKRIERFEAVLRDNRAPELKYTALLEVITAHPDMVLERLHAN